MFSQPQATGRLVGWGQASTVHKSTMLHVIGRLAAGWVGQACRPATPALNDNDHRQGHRLAAVSTTMASRARTAATGEIVMQHSTILINYRAQAVGISGLPGSRWFGYPDCHAGAAGSPAVARGLLGRRLLHEGCYAPIDADRLRFTGRQLACGGCWGFASY